MTDMAEDRGSGRLRVAYLITRSEHGGAQSHLLQLIDGLSEWVDPFVMVGDTGFLTRSLESRSVRHTVIPELVRAIHPVKDVIAITKISRLLGDERIQILHSHTAKSGVAGRICSAIRGVPCIFTPHGWAFSERNGGSVRLLALAAEKLLSCTTAAYIAVADDELRMGVTCGVAPRRYFHHIPNGITDLPSPRGAEGHPNCPPRVIMVARMAPPKDFDLLLRAMADIEEEYRLVLVGDGPLRGEIEAKIEKLGIGGRVLLLGLRDDVPVQLARSAIFVLSSLSEALPVSIIEAMRAGLPVVASDVGGVNELIEDGATGYLTPRGDKNALREAIRTLIRDGALRQKQGRAGRARYEEKFSALSMCAKVNALYRKVVAEAEFGAEVSGTWRERVPPVTAPGQVAEFKLQRKTSEIS